MSAVSVEILEARHLADVLSVIERRIASLEKQRVKGAGELVSYRKYMWEDAALFDRAERVQSENVALTQEQAVLDVATRLRRLRTLSASPYFGRIDFREAGLPEAEQVYIGLHGLFDDCHNMLIYDWRAPISGLFYDFEVGPALYVAPEGEIAGDVLLKRQYKIGNGTLLYVLDSSLAINDEILRDVLARNTSEKMRQIVNTIQREQNAIIRSEDRKIVIVQGPAGSGKTSIAMHRAAYLLYRHRGHISANNLLIFSPNEVFADYISDVLPELGEENIREATFDDYSRSILGPDVPFEPRTSQLEFILSASRDSEYALRTAGIAFKSSLAFLHILQAYARHLKHTILRFRDIVLNNTLVLRKSVVEELYWEHCADLPIMRGIERLKDRVLSRATYSSEIAERKILREVDRVVVQRNPVRLYRDLFKDPALIRKLCDGEALPDKLHGICKSTYKSLHWKRVPCEDVAPILLLKRLIDGEPRYANIRHLVIDEAQDYTPVHFEIIRSLFGSSSMTILGDLCQRINSYSGIDGYDALRQVFGREANEVIRLTKTYRSSWEISEFARGILPEADEVENVRRTGRRPRVVSAATSDEALDLISAELTELKVSGMTSIAVICKTADEAFRVYSKLLHNHEVHLVESQSITFHHGLVVLPVYLAKGLEFDAVVVRDASQAVYGDESERRLLYTACTRALHSLTVYFTGNPSPLLPVHKPDLYVSA